MARELNYTISDVFGGTRTTSRGMLYGHYINETQTKKVYMDIPINQPVFEMPIFAFKTFLKTLGEESAKRDAIVAVLRTRGFVPGYVTLNRYMQDVLLNDYKRNSLIKLEVKDGENNPLLYYASQGIILDKDYQPIMMCSWQIMRYKDKEGYCRYEFVRPIMRIAPECYVHKENAMERFIVNKLPVIALTTPLYQPNSMDVPECFEVDQRCKDLRVEIDKCPFALRCTDMPSISTTNEGLLQVAIDHIDEIIQ